MIQKRPSPRRDGLLADSSLRWDGHERLTITGEPHFIAYVSNPLALAELLLKISAVDMEPTEAEAKAFVEDVIGRFWPAAFTLHPEAPAAWLESHRKERTAC